MAATKYTYSIAGDFPNAKVASDRLTSEIQLSAIITALDHIETLGDVCDIWFKDALSVPDEAILDGLVAVHDGTPLPDNTPRKVELTDMEGVAVPVTSTRSPIIALTKSDDLKATIFSHLWNDRTTWFGQSVRVVNEASVAVDQPNGLWGLANQNVIDTYHGKILGEDFLKDSLGNSYRVVVTVNGAAKTEQDPHLGAGGDYTVDYDGGQIQFTAGNFPGALDDVRVTYYYENGSRFIIAPLPGKILALDSVEVQFSEGLVITDSAIFQVMGLVDIFAPGLMPGIPSGTKIPISDPLVYKGMRDYLSDARKSYVAYPAMGGPGWRGVQTPIYVFNWDYVASTVLKASWGMEIHVSLEHDVPFTGAFASATFYCTSRDE